MQAFQAASDNTYVYFVLNGNIINMLKEIYVYAPRAFVLDIQAQIYKDDIHVSITFFTSLINLSETGENRLIFPLTGNVYNI